MTYEQYIMKKNIKINSNYEKLYKSPYYKFDLNFVDVEYRDIAKNMMLMSEYQIQEDRDYAKIIPCFNIEDMFNSKYTEEIFFYDVVKFCMEYRGKNDKYCGKEVYNLFKKYDNKYYIFSTNITVDKIILTNVPYEEIHEFNLGVDRYSEMVTDYYHLSYNNSIAEDKILFAFFRKFSYGISRR